MAEKKGGPAIPKEAPVGSATPGGTLSGNAKPPPEGNPVFRMMGMPNFKLKLPSRNWSIFLTVVGTWTAAVVYDRQQKKKIQQKWAKAVSHLAKEPLPSTALQRKVTIFLSAPPADGLLTAREHYYEYVKPILVESGLDWDAVEGRKEGDVRAGLAERIRKLRQLKGEKSETPVPEDDLEVLMAGMHERMNVRKVDGVEGDIVIGRNTWKEYIRGLHEGWLGPLDAPKVAEEPTPETTVIQDEVTAPQSEHLTTDRPHGIASIPNYAAEQVVKSLPHGDKPETIFDSTGASTELDNASPSAPLPGIESKSEKKAEEKPKEDDSKPKKPKQPPPFISTSAYSSASPSPSIPAEFAPSVVIPVPHILGFLNTHIRIYRFLTRRYVADEIGRQVAAACFAAYAPYEQFDGSTVASPFPSDAASPSTELSPEPTAQDNSVSDKSE